MTRLSFRREAGLAIGVLTIWIIGSMVRPRHVDLTRFDGREIGRLETAMWRSYYERRPAALFWQVGQSLRTQFHTGFVRSIPTAYHAAKAAFDFKDGRNRADYAKALPDLERYFASINAIAADRFDPAAAARDELEWWIIRRERDRHTTAEWEQLIAAVASEMYHVPAQQLSEYARLRVAAMELRDERGAQITESDWRRIGGLLERSWESASEAVRGP